MTELAARFWIDAGEPPPFPRDLRAVAHWFPELHVKEVPHLTAALAAEHFARFNILCPDARDDRPLRGCFGASHGTALILIDPTDVEDEVRFTFAHELAHFLRDYQDVRRKAVAKFGPDILAVLDGDRSATPGERLAGALRGVTVGCHAHFLDRDRWGRVVTEAAFEAEEAADRLAFELLAPFDAVNPDACPPRAALHERLTSVFGLPPTLAIKYATILLD